MSNIYSDKFFEFLEQTSDASAREIVPLVLSLITHPSSLIDIGGGAGCWANHFQLAGVPHVVCIDGEYVNRSKLKVAEDCFIPVDLTRPFNLGRKYDLSVCLEVAEHLPESAADTFIDSIVRHAPVVLFSAAIPFQGGTDHINEQWPDYWTLKFRAHGFRCFDPFREQIWNNENVSWWYKQNILLYASNEWIEVDGKDCDIEKYEVKSPMRLIHPEKYLALTRELLRPRISRREALRARLVKFFRFPQGDPGSST